MGDAASALLDPRQDFRRVVAIGKLECKQFAMLDQSAVVGRGTAEDGYRERMIALWAPGSCRHRESRSPCAGCARCAPGPKYWSVPDPVPFGDGLFRFDHQPAGEVSQDVLKTESDRRCSNRRCSDESSQVDAYPRQKLDDDDGIPVPISSSMRIRGARQRFRISGKEEIAVRWEPMISQGRVPLR